MYDLICCSENGSRRSFGRLSPTLEDKMSNISLPKPAQLAVQAQECKYDVESVAEVAVFCKTEYCSHLWLRDVSL
jgi:hypothetical protein